MTEGGETADVVIIGGGSAGISSALAAARQGSSTILLERSALLGGMGSQALVHTFCGLYHPSAEGKPAEIANRGIPEEIERKMRDRSGQDGPETMGKVYVLPHSPATFDKVAKELVLAQEGLDLRLGCSCTGIYQSTDQQFVVSCQKENGEDQKILCKSLVDCSANAIVAEFLGQTRVQAESSELQRPAFIFRLNDIAPKTIDERFSMRLALDLVHAVRNGKLPQEALGATIRQSPEPGQCHVSIDIDPDLAWNPGKNESRSEVKTIGEKLAHLIRDFLKDNHEGFTNASEPIFPKTIGVRESYRWIGQYVLTQDDLVEQKPFSDVVAYASWPIELRENAKGPRFTFFNKAESSEIPLRSLMSANVPGVYCAGRCLSATHEALASVRVMGTCFATGQAAGIAAALFAQGTEDRDSQARNNSAKAIHPLTKQYHFVIVARETQFLRPSPKRGKK